MPAVNVGEGGSLDYFLGVRQRDEGVAFQQGVVEGQALARHHAAVVVEAIAHNPTAGVRLGVTLVGAVVAVLESVEAYVADLLQARSKSALGHLDCAAPIPRTHFHDVRFARCLDGRGQQLT